MAKDKKNGNEQKAVAVVAQSLTAENVMDNLHKGNLMQGVLTKQVLDDIQKEKDERKAEQLKSRILKASYHRIRRLIQLRARRRESEINLENLKQAELLEDSLAGFILTDDKIKKHGGKDGKLETEVIDDAGKKTKTSFELKENEEVWVPGSITIAEYDEKENELVADMRKKMAESDKQLQKELTELRNQYPSYYSYSWDW